MGRTLFAYIFKDLLKFFLLASLALSAIMSFGGLLRPLTKQGLDMGQVGMMLAYLIPAMSTYALPIAALFASTMVYGRLAADNELTACRAGGISYLAVAAPALCLGLVVAIMSLLLLCFIVPLFTFRVEKVLYSNIAGLISTRVQRNHEVSLRGFTIYADNATVLPSSDGVAQQVRLDAPTLITYDNIQDNGRRVRIPRDFWMARSAIAFIQPSRGDQRVMLSIRLEDGVKFPREQRGGVKVNIGETEMGEIELPMDLREATKFMDILELKRQYADPGASRRIRQIVAQFVQADMERSVRARIGRELGERGRIVFDSTPYSYGLGAPGAKIEQQGEATVITAPGDQRTIKFVERKQEGGDETSYTAKVVHIRVRPDTESGRVQISADLLDAVSNKGGAFPRRTFSFGTPMPAETKAIASQGMAHYLKSGVLDSGQHDLLLRSILIVRNRVLSEVHGRASFGISCLILVMVGSALGIMFKSGNFLSAFAVSAVPALLCLALIMTGQQAADSLVASVPEAGRNLRTGLTLIWSGNLAVLVAAVYLSGRLQRQ